MKLRNLQILCTALLLIVVTNAQNLLSGPECVSFDSLHNRYIVSNWTNGKIIEIDSAGNQSIFHSGFSHAYGNYIFNNTFYVSNGKSIFGFDLDNPADTVLNLRVSGAAQMDGMTVDNNNNLYVVDVTYGKVFKINLDTQKHNLFVSGVSSHPQDIVFDEANNRLLICAWYDGSPIQAVNLTDSSLTDVVATPYGNCDGLSMDENGNYYFSTWTDNSVYYYDHTFTNPPTKLTDGLNGPANISYNKRDKLIVVPDFNSNSLKYIPIPVTSVEEELEVPNMFEVYQNYPNPFNPETEIRYTLTTADHVTIKIYDLLGKEVATLVNENQKSGEHSITFKPDNLSSGIYFYSISTPNFSKTRKMVYSK